MTVDWLSQRFQVRSSPQAASLRCDDNTHRRRHARKDRIRRTAQRDHDTAGKSGKKGGSQHDRPLELVAVVVVYGLGRQVRLETLVERARSVRRGQRGLVHFARREEGRTDLDAELAAPALSSRPEGRSLGESAATIERLRTQGEKGAQRERRARTDCLKPPKGIWCDSMTYWLTQTVPALSRRMTRWTWLMSAHGRACEGTSKRRARHGGRG